MMKEMQTPKTQPATRYIIEMYRAYAAEDKSKEELEKQLGKEKAKKEKDNNKIAYLKDVLAIANVMDRLESENNQELVKVLKDTYLAIDSTSRGEITRAVNKTAINNYMGEATVYRYLKVARTLAAEERGLRML